MTSSWTLTPMTSHVYPTFTYRCPAFALLLPCFTPGCAYYVRKRSDVNGVTLVIQKFDGSF